MSPWYASTSDAKRVRTGVAAQLLVLERDAERGLDRGRAGVGVEDAREPGRRDLDERVRQLDRGHAAEAEQRRVRDALELRAQRGVERRVAVAVHVAPERRDAVEVAPAVRVDELVALAPRR